VRPDARDQTTQLWVGPLRDHSGHADETRGFLRALEAAGHAPAAREISWTKHAPGLNPSDERMLARQLARRMPRPDVAIHTYLPFARQATVPNSINVARAMFETDRMPASWLEPLLDRDEIWVPCEHNLKTFVRSGLPEAKLRVIGGTLDFDLFARGCEPLQLPGDPDRLAFLSNFDFSERKGWRQLIAAWAAAFGPDDPVRLVLKTGSFYRSDEHVRERIESFVRDEFGTATGLAPIHLYTERLDALDLPRLYAAADAYVLPSRGEGWGRPFMEALALGLPTVASRYAGVLAFMDDSYSWLVDGSLVAVPDDAELFNSLYRGHRWFEADVDALTATLREIAADPEAARRKAEPARAALLERFGPEATAERVAAAAAAARERHGASPAFCAIRGDFGGGSSLATVNDGLAEALARRGRRVLHRPRGGAPAGQLCAGISHGWPPEFDPASAGPAVAILPWEFGAPPREWVERARAQLDRVWVPSEYVRRGFVESGMPPALVEVVPNGVDLEAFSDEGPRRPLGAEAGCTFLFVGGTTWRKGIDLLIEAWRQAFDPDDNVLLVVKDFGAETFYRGQTRGDRVQALAKDPGVAPVLYVGDDLARSELPSLYRAADVLVAPYRAEGFCLPVLEAMACGVPAIHTAGPSAEFSGPEHGWPLEPRRIPLPADAGLPELAGKGFALEPDLDELVAALRAAATGEADRRVRGRAARRGAEAWSWDAAAKVAERSLEQLAASGVPLARGIQPAALETRELAVAFAPDWSDQRHWWPALQAWAQVFKPDDPVTLVLHAGDQHSSQAIGARVLQAFLAARLNTAALPDLVVCGEVAGGLPSLVSRCEAVLLDAAQAQLPPATLVARAPRVLTPDSDLRQALKLAL
jgi:glycosyltransferase involved in cell wall biosynthesis